MKSHLHKKVYIIIQKPKYIIICLTLTQEMRFIDMDYGII